MSSIEYQEPSISLFGVIVLDRCKPSHIVCLTKLRQRKRLNARGD